MGVLGKLAYGDGATVGTLLAVRFLLAALLFWALVLATGGAGEIRALRGRDVAVALGLGACGYATQAGGYFAALERIDASLVALLIYTFPAIVAVAAVVLGRERFDGRRLTGLGLASGGLVLVLASAGAGALEPVGTALALGAAVVYSAYILVSEGVAGRMRPSVLSALVSSGAALSLTVGSALLGQLRPGEVTGAGWGWLACLAVVSTVAAVNLFFAGLRRVGPMRASILSTVEPVVTVLLAYLVFGEALGGVQLLGGALVLGAVLALNARLPRIPPSQPPLVEVVERAVGLAFPVAEPEALVEGPRGDIVLARAEVHMGGTGVAGGVHRGLHQRPPESLPAPLGDHVELLQVAVERVGPDRGPEPEHCQPVRLASAEQDRDVAGGE
jgi:drug/metabolite transporter (DMT)-like permease